MAKRRVVRESVVQPQDQSIRYIPLTQGQVAIVSAHRYDSLSQRNWHAAWNSCTNSFYAGTNIPTLGAKRFKTKMMHAMILDLADGAIGDHVNGDTLDNRDENLRKATHCQNTQNHKTRKDNASGKSGVTWDEESGYWVARISVNGKRIFLGRYFDKEAAIDARIKAEAVHHGEFSRNCQISPLTSSIAGENDDVECGAPI